MFLVPLNPYQKDFGELFIEKLQMLDIIKEQVGKIESYEINQTDELASIQFGTILLSGINSLRYAFRIMNEIFKRHMN